MQKVINKEKYEEILDVYIKSCAGYCIVNYVLGVGNNHLNNLMIDKLGHLFTLKFEFILGKNPSDKSMFSPPMYLNKVMIDAMGGK